MKEEFENQTRPVSVEWVGGELEGRDPFLTSLGLNPARWREAQIARISQDTEFEIFGLKLHPREPYSEVKEWKCRVERFSEGCVGFTINGALVAANLSGGVATEMIMIYGRNGCSLSKR